MSIAWPPAFPITLSTPPSGPEPPRKWLTGLAIESNHPPLDFFLAPLELPLLKRLDQSVPPPLLPLLL